MGRHALLEAPDGADAEAAAPSSGPVRSVADILAEYRRTGGPPRRSPDVPAHGAPESHARDDRSAAAWEAALCPAPTGSVRRQDRTGTGSSAADVIATLTAELAIVHPSLLAAGASRHRHATTPGRSRVSTRLLQFPRFPQVTTAFVGSGWQAWRVPARTPLVLAGAVALSVVVTDQAGLLSASSTAVALGTSGTISTAANFAADQGSAATDAQDDLRQSANRVSRSERSAIPGTAASPAAGDASAVVAPGAVSTMKPGQTVPGTWVRPSPTGIYNSCFCSRWGTFHEGIDFAAPLGSPILAVGDGTVIDAGPASGFGNWVVIQLANGDVSIYGHMRYFYVKVGQQVTAGQEIAVVGEEGEATGPHLHLGIRQGARPVPYVDPVPWLTARGVAVGVYNQNG